MSLTRSPTVSAIIPVHNGVRFIGEAVRSVLDQTHAVCECIVVDDGSTDGSTDGLEGLSSRVRLIRQDRSGVAAARNAGMRAAQGEYIGFLDADDVWLPEKLERQLEALGRVRRAAASYTGYVITSPSLEPRRVVVHRRRTRRPAVERALLVEGPGLGFSFTALVPRALAQQAGGFREHLSTSADIDFAWRLAQIGPLVGVRAPLACHRRHSPDQMHRDIARVEREMAAVVDAAGADGLPEGVEQRARENMLVHSAATLVLRGEVASGARHLLALARADPVHVSRLLAAATGQRTLQRWRSRTLRPR